MPVMERAPDASARQPTQDSGTRGTALRVAITLCVPPDRLRDARRASAVSLDSVGELPDRLPEPLPEVDSQRLQEVLNELPEEFRTPVILFYFEDFSYRDIAEQIDLPMGTVMSRLARAKAYLRSRLLPPAAAVAAEGRRRASDGL